MELYQGIVEDIHDPLKSGRVRVRVFGLHTDDKSLIPTDTLPWAQVVKSTDSASVSGIGHSAMGLVAGAWVIVYYLDEDHQYPIVLGSLHGIPVDPVNDNAVNEEITKSGATPVTTTDGTVLTTTDGTPVTTGTETPATTNDVGAKRATDFTSVSQKCIDIIKSVEGFAATAYFDVNAYTIGYGTRIYPNGEKVKQGDVATKAQAESYLLYDVNKTFLPKIHKSVTVPVTQEMVDALVSLVYNVGSVGAKSMIMTDLNSGKYELAAARFLEYNKIRDSSGTLVASRGLTTRREKEKNLFLSGGFPSSVGGMEPAPEQPYAADPVPQKNPDAAKPSANEVLSERGFSDPKAKYPLYRNEPDTHRLSRHEKIIDTIVYKKEIGREKNVPIAGTESTWNQSPIPYNTQYPLNRVFCSETGHLLEFDDTPNSRRIHLYHASGTFTEIDDNGTRVNKIVGDGYTILERNGYVHIKGASNVTVDGAHNLKVEGTANIDIDGATNINVFNDVTLKVSGDLKTSVKGNYYVKVDGKFAIDAKRIDLNSGVTKSLDSPEDKREPDTVEMAELTVVTRATEGAMQYETPEEGDATKYNTDRVNRGEVAKEELVDPTPKEPEPVTEQPPERAIVGDCGEIHTMTEFPANYRISTHFTIGSFNKNGARTIIPQLGLRSDQIACNLKMLAINALDLVKDLYPNMIISSGFRRPGDAKNSSATSKHYTGEAVDIQLPGFSRQQYLEAVKNIAATIKYDQLILEYEGSTTWIHIGYSKTSTRKQLFTMSNHKRISDFGQLVLV